jgi:high-affinity Fe2+/Pb2+ permease
MARGLRQALVMLAVAAAVSLGVAAVWAGISGEELRRTFSITLMVVAGLLALTGGTALSRASTNDVRAFLGRGPDNEEPDSGEGLTGIGVFLLVSVPLLVAGLLLHGGG